MVAQIVRDQQCRQRFRKAGHVLRDVDECDSEIARGMQHRKPKRADQDHIAGRGRALLPQLDRPGEQAERQDDGHHGVKDTEPLEIEQAPSPSVHLAFDGCIETEMFAEKAAERAHEWHIGHDVGHFAVDCRGLAREVVVQRPACCGEAEHDANHDAGHKREACGHR